MSITTVSQVTQQQLTSTAPSRGATVARHALVGGAIGAVAAAGLSFTALPFIGALSAPLAAAIGGAAGLVVGGIVGLFRSRGADQARNAAAVVQVPPPPSTSTSSLPPAPPVPPTAR